MGPLWSSIAHRAPILLLGAPVESANLCETPIADLSLRPDDGRVHFPGFHWESTTLHGVVPAGLVLPELRLVAGWLLGAGWLSAGGMQPASFLRN